MGRKRRERKEKMASTRAAHMTEGEERNWAASFYGLFLPKRQGRPLPVVFFLFSIK
jgi:hypothetical protein